MNLNKQIAKSLEYQNEIYHGKWQNTQEIAEAFGITVEELRDIVDASSDMKMVYAFRMGDMYGWVKPLPETKIMHIEYGLPGVLCFDSEGWKQVKMGDRL